ncbi:hypothetical protein GFC01_00175 [Desulfofundulus thermobenzoicus]|uniref:Ubiquitin Mut7-C domain-containing protein n=1 Tax=Desulfofundulus thermobenzoicus TaxID=29376 RepID=A0A6N7IL69_9FIRM|nr:MoaD/ThiS family protein [Desulfofundulus thermobenzoicus]MQL50720.1 hypothetical protein [Desulfofundulus thermobenzoicus]
MYIQLKLFGPLEKYSKIEGAHQVEVGLTVRVADLLSQVEVPLTAIGFIAVNGIKAGLNYQLQEGDEVIVFPHVSGG